jgi:hypothetical protein
LKHFDETKIISRNFFENGIIKIGLIFLKKFPFRAILRVLGINFKSVERIKIVKKMTKRAK